MLDQSTALSQYHWHELEHVSLLPLFSFVTVVALTVYLCVILYLGCVEYVYYTYISYIVL